MFGSEHNDRCDFEHEPGAEYSASGQLNAAILSENRKSDENEEWNNAWKRSSCYKPSEERDSQTTDEEVEQSASG